MYKLNNNVLTVIILLSVTFFCDCSTKDASTKQQQTNNSLSNYERFIQASVLKIDAELDTAQYTNRQRFINPFTIDGKYNCNYNPSAGINRQLLKKMMLCMDNKDSETIAYHLFLKPCETIVDEDFRIFTLDKEQKDSSILLVAICEGDAPVEKVIGTTLGTFLVFKKQNDSYQLTDVGFGKLVAFDCDKNNRLQPIIFGESQNYSYPDYEEKSTKPNYLEMRLNWNGEHLETSDIISIQLPERDKIEQILSNQEVKNQNLYKSIKDTYINHPDDILENIKIHWRFRSWSLKYRKEANTIQQHKNKWIKGFKIE